MSTLFHPAAGGEDAIPVLASQRTRKGVVRYGDGRKELDKSGHQRPKTRQANDFKVVPEQFGFRTRAKREQIEAATDRVWPQETDVKLRLAVKLIAAPGNLVLEGAFVERVGLLIRCHRVRAAVSESLIGPR